ncbi:MAG: DUF1440 domain-containing protein [Actinomycetota bacterium]|nr:DUF1440 domain-containing protein [Actinomycetota bacterium]
MSRQPGSSDDSHPLSDSSQPIRPRDVAHATARGVVAAMSMTAMRAVTGGLDIVDQTPPQAMIRQLIPGLIKKVPRGRRDAIIELAHWAYGGLGGAGYGMLPDKIRDKPWAGPVYGLLIWLGFELGIAPLMGMRQALNTGRTQERVALAADHALYGLVLSEIRPTHKTSL